MIFVLNVPYFAFDCQDLLALLSIVKEENIDKCRWTSGFRAISLFYVVFDH